MSSTHIATHASTPPTSHTFTRAVDAACTPLDDLRQCASISTLRAAVSALCSRHGDLRHLDIVPTAQAGRRQALCFLRMQTDAAELSLMQSLGIGRFGGELVLVVDLSRAAGSGQLDVATAEVHRPASVWRGAAPQLFELSDRHH